MIFSETETADLAHRSLAGRINIWIPIPSSRVAADKAFSNARDASRLDSMYVAIG